MLEHSTVAAREIIEDPRTPLVRDARALLSRVIATHHSDILRTERLALRDQLRRTLANLARIEHAKHVSAERLLALVRDLVVDADVKRLGSDEQRALTEDVIRWSIEAYYAA